MLYHSTRNKNEVMSSREAVLQGLARDGGLFVTDDLDRAQIDPASLRGSYMDTAKRVFSLLLDDYTEEELESAIHAAYGHTFTAPEVTPVTKLGEMHLLELYHGPTSAFKDVPGIGISVFYPEGGVSAIQELQMSTQEGKNVAVSAVNGNFDDAQTAVKKLFSSDAVAELAALGVSLSSANSINVGRLVPQIVYYFDAYKQLMEQGVLRAGDPIDFTVPTGNFGDVLAGYCAKRMGLPVRHLVVASNANNVLTAFLTTGVYDRRRDLVKTISPSMDILVSSNLERALYWIDGGNAERTLERMKALQTEGVYRVDAELLAKLQETFLASFSNDDETKDAIRRAWEDEGRLIDPHTAVAWRAAESHFDPKVPMVVLSTASPYKFCRDVYEAIWGEIPGTDAFAYMDALCDNTGVELPKALAGLRTKPVRWDDCTEIADIPQYVVNAAKRIF